MRRLLRIVGGSILVGVGTVMLIVPGPGLLTIVAGLGVLARDLPGARRLLDRGRRVVGRFLGSSGT